MKLIQEASPRWTKAWAILLLIQGLLPVASVYLIRLLVDSLVAAANSNGSWGRPVIFGALMAGTQLLAELLLGLNEWVRTAQSELIQDHIKDLVHAKSVSLDLAFFDSPDYYDRLHRATDEGSNRPLALLESTGSLLQNGMTVVGMAAVLIPYGLWLPILLVIGTLPALYVVIRFNRRYHGWWQQTTPDRRWSSYYDVMLTHNQAASELRMFGLGGPFRAAYNSLRSRLRGERLDLTRDQAFARLAASIIALLTMAVAMLLLGLRALRGALTLGDLALLYQAFNSGQDLMRSLLSNLGQIYSNTFYLGNLFEFLALSPTVTDPPRPVHTSTFLSEGIRFRHVAFGYSSDRPPAIRDFDLTIPKGMVVAIVGPNGAGKSTLVKLLCRFYDPDSGCIELDNVDLRAMPLEQVRRTITVLFQQPVPYHATAGQNIAIADLASRPSTDRIEAAARNSGAHEIIGRLPKGYDTLLGKWFADGAELSAGEWQRLALARAYVRAAEIVVLDEPTSFMDSWAETDWFDRLRALVKGRTAIVITHRFTIAMRADIIHVMNEGRIIESGSHNDLLARGGFYAESWTAQMQAARALAVPVSVDDLSFAAAETSASTEMH